MLLENFVFGKAYYGYHVGLEVDMEVVRPGVSGKPDTRYIIVVIQARNCICIVRGGDKK